MFRKLVKYEWSAMIRSMMPIYGAAIAVSVLNSLFLNMFVEGDGPIARFWQWLTTYFGGIVCFDIRSADGSGCLYLCCYDSAFL